MIINENNQVEVPYDMMYMIMMELVHITIKLLSAQAARMLFKVRCSLLLQIQIGLQQF